MTDVIVARVELRAAPNAEAYKRLHREMAAIGFSRTYQNQFLPSATYVRAVDGSLEAALEEVREVAIRIQKSAEIVLTKGTVLTAGLPGVSGAQALDASDAQGTSQEKLDLARTMFWRREPNAALDAAGEILLGQPPELHEEKTGGANPF